MVRRTWRIPQMRLTCLLQLTALALYGCGGGGNGSPGPGSGGSSGKDGPAASDTSMMGDSASMNDTAAADGNPDAVADDAGAGSGGAGGSGTGGTVGAGGSGGTKADAAPGTGGKTTADAAADTAPPICQAGEDCTGDYSCTASRCVRQEQEVCHCVNQSLFCGPVSCAPDAGAADATPPTDAAAAVCPNSTSTGDKCDSATERMCAFPCTNNRHRECFCSQTLNEWVCTGATRC